MRWAVEKDSLLSTLNRVSRIIKSNPRSVDILQCIKVSTYSNEVYLTAVSSMANVKVQVPGAVVGESGEFVINLDRFRDRVSKAGSRMRLDSDGMTLKIFSSDDQRLGLKLADPREYPSVEWVVVDESYGLKSADFLSLIRTANSLTSSVTSLTPAFLQVKLKNKELWVSSGVTYHRFDVECNPELDSTIPVQTLSALAAFIQESGGDTIWLSQGDQTEVVVSVGNDQFQTSALAVQFPDLEPLFERVRISSDLELKVNRRALIEELNKAKTSVDEYGRVRLTFDGKVVAQMNIHTESASGDWYESKIPCVWTGSEDRELVFNIDTLTRFLQSFNHDEIELGIGEDFKKDLSALYCSEEEHSGIINQFRI